MPSQTEIEQRRRSESQAETRKMQEIARQCAREMVSKHAEDCSGVQEIKEILREMREDSKAARKKNAGDHEEMCKKLHGIDLAMLDGRNTMANHDDRIRANTRAREEMQKGALALSWKIIFILVALLVSLIGAGNLIGMLSATSQTAEPIIERIAQ